MPIQNEAPIETNEVLRKGLHIVVALFPFVMLQVGRTMSLAILIPVTLLALSAEYARSRSPRFEDIITSMFGAMMRPDEHSTQGRIIINGATWVLISLTTLTVFFELRVVAASFVMFMLADAAAALVGKGLGRHQWPWSDRTLEGSAAFLLFACASGLLFPDFAFLAVLLAAAIGTFVESLPAPIDDNILVPVCMAIVFTFGDLLI